MSVNTAQYPATVWDSSAPNRSTDRSIDRKPDFEDWDQAVAEMIATQTELNKLKFMSMVNGSGGTLVAGTPVYPKATHGGCAAADRDGTTVTRDVVGLVVSDALTTAATNIQLAGILELTTAQWDTIAGTTGGLTADTSYYLDVTAGKITATRPSTTVGPIVLIGIAKSTTKIQVICKTTDAVIS